MQVQINFAPKGLHPVHPTFPEVPRLSVPGLADSQNTTALLHQYEPLPGTFHLLHVQVQS